MILNSKQLEELESLHDVGADFDEENEDSDLLEDGADSALAWRRSMIERAASRVKQISALNLNHLGGLTKGTLIFDGNANKFGRVLEFNDGIVRITYVSGGEAELSKDSKHQHNPASKSDLNAIQKATVVALKPASVESKKSLGEATIKTPHKEEVQKPKVVLKKDVVKKSSEKKPTIVRIKSMPKPAKKPIAVHKHHKPNKIKLAAKSKNIPVAYKSILPPGITTDPIADPNGYIQQNFHQMSNKELAEITGLSEHTIRRKLGEWGLKRKR